ncbi:DUF397 domain-containing protein [Spirillospora sp. NPDC052242]
MDLSKATWRKSVRSSEQGDNCVELASVSGIVAIRDSKDPVGPKLVVSRRDFRRFAEVLKEL